MPKTKRLADNVPESDLELLRLDEAATILGWTPSHLLSLIENRPVKAIKLDLRNAPLARRYRLTRREVRYWLRRGAAARRAIADKMLDTPHCGCAAS
jgi:hypothetical protein